MCEHIEKYRVSFGDTTSSTSRMQNQLAQIVMLRNLLSNRWFQGGLVFFLLVIAGSLLYGWSTLRVTERDMERHNRFLQGIEKQNETRPAEAANVPTENEAPGRVSTPAENTDTPMSDESEALPNETETLDFANLFLPENMASAAEAPNEEVPASPFGFGAYPEIPPGFPKNLMPSWTWSDERKQNMVGQLVDFELMDRVLIKLWNQGDRSFIGVKRHDQSGKVYPIYQNVMYVENWIERRNGEVRLPASFFGQSDEDINVVDIMRYENVPTSITFLDAHTEGYDPYQFLGLE